MTKTQVQKLGYEPQKSLGFDIFFNNLMIWMSESNRDKRIKCQKSADRLLCTGSRSALFTLPKHWNVSFLYDEKHVQTLDVTYDIKIYNQTEGKPEEFSEKLCSRYVDYNLTVLPNLLGQMHVKDIFAAGLIGEFENLQSCYQHAVLGACRSFLPEFRGRIYYPCRKMCEDGLRGCWVKQKHDDFYLVCSWLEDTLDPDICYYKPVSCHPVNVSEGVRLEYERHGEHEEFRPGDQVRSFCERGYSRGTGEAVRNCTYSGEWGGKPFICQKDASPLAFILPIAGTVLVLIVVICLAARMEHDLYTTEMMPVPKDDNYYRYDNFICYSDDDEDCICGVFEYLESEANDMVLCIHRRDFNPGLPSARI